MANPDNFILSIVNQSGATKLQKLIDAVSTAINQKKLGLGEILPSVNQLSGKLNISRDTVFKAYKELVRRGLIVSSPTKGYFVAGSNSKILLLLDEFSPFKDVLYESFAHNLPGNYQVDLAFHHYNHRIFETIVLDSIGWYNMYAIMNINNITLHKTLKKIDPNKLLLLDLGDFEKTPYAYVCQDFGLAAYQCLMDARELIEKYRKVIYYYPKGSIHPDITFDFFSKFCKENHIYFRKATHLSRQLFQKGNAFISFRQKELVEILKFSKAMNLGIGKDIGIITYNDAPLFEVIENGITSISTDFAEMGRKAAEFVSTKQKVECIIPSKLIVRGSL